MSLQNLQYDEAAYRKQLRQNYFFQNYQLDLQRFKNKSDCIPQVGVNTKNVDYVQPHNPLVEIESLLQNRYTEHLKGDRLKYNVNQHCNFNKDISQPSFNFNYQSAPLCHNNQQGTPPAFQVHDNERYYQSHYVPYQYSDYQNQRFPKEIENNIVNKQKQTLSDFYEYDAGTDLGVAFDNQLSCGYF